MSRFWLVPLVLAVFVVGPFLLWGDRIEAVIAPDPETGAVPGGVGWLWLAAIGLLVADILIPVPTTSIIAALGIAYGPVTGALVAAAGSMLAAAIGYAIGRWLGRPVAARFVGEAMRGGEEAFARYGGWLVAGSRWMPVLPEVVSVVAGVSRMPFGRFMAAAACGVAPFSATFAAIGHFGAERPVWTLAFSAVAPLILWALARRLGWLKRFDRGAS